MKKVIITGATSMIGIALTRLLLDKKVHVTAIIRKDSPRRQFLPQSDLFEIVECNLENIKDLNLKSAGYDCMYHLAWEATGKSTRNDPHLQSKNIGTTLDCVELCQRCGCKAFVGAGSQAEYGIVDGIIPETKQINPDTAYGISKYAACGLSKILCNKYDIRHVWTRIFSIYGLHDGENTLISYLLREDRQGAEWNLTKCEQIWDFLNIDDCANALYLLGTKGRNNEVYNIASGKAEPLKNFIEIIRRNINSEIKINYGAVEYSSNQVMNLRADITKLKNDTGFEPVIDFNTGILSLLKGEQ